MTTPFPTNKPATVAIGGRVIRDASGAPRQFASEAAARAFVDGYLASRRRADALGAPPAAADDTERTTPCKCNGSTCRCPPGYWPSPDELMAATLAQNYPRTAQAIITPKGDTSMHTDSQHPLDAARARNRQHMQSMWRTDAADDPIAAAPAQREAPHIERMASLIQRSMSGRGADQPNEAEREELARLIGAAGPNEHARAIEIATGRREVARRQLQEDDERRARMQAQRVADDRARTLAAAEGSASKRTDGAEHPLDAARAQHRDRMRRLAER